MNDTYNNTSEILNALNANQQEAVAYCDGPSLVIAGAGSGKTRVLTYKIAYLLERGLPPHSILALTFTNKAAREMRERISTVVGYEKAKRLCMGTFHSVFSHILRMEADKLGYTKDFTIYDTADTKSVLKSIVKQMKLDEKQYKTSKLYGRISSAKNNLMSPANYAKNADMLQTDKVMSIYRASDVYAEYAKRCKLANAMDFDDLLYNINVLFRDYPEVLRKYQERFSYILVDAYQDTNFAQYLIVKKLAEVHQRICVVGDDAQSIYAFRGANIGNILKFQQQYSTSRLFKLERNYRSTQNIVDAANNLIKSNREQIKKDVYSKKEVGEPLHVLNSFSDIEEATQVAENIQNLHREGESDYQNMAVLYRTNAQSRVLEESLRKYNIPYRIYGGLSFYQRKEVKNALAYMRLVINPQDEESLKRIINFPARGIGDTTVNKVLTTAEEQGVSAWQVIEDPLQYNLPVNAGTAKKLENFRVMISGFSELSDTLNAYELTENIIKTSGMAADALAEKSTEGVSRYENLQELLNGIHEYVGQRLEDGEEQVSLSNFLSEVALLTDQDGDKEEDENRVTLMTVHAAKGLEFGTVFIVGMEEDLFPSSMADTPADVEEERRLLYVAITRAEKRCYMSYSRTRFRNGKTNTCTPSRFFFDIDDKYYDRPVKKQTVARSDFDYDFDQGREVFGHGSGSTPTYIAPKPAVSSPPKPTNLKKMGTTYLAKEEKQVLHNQYTEGIMVEHGTFGIGKVLSSYVENGSEKVDVNFGEKGTKSLLIKYAKLSILK